MKEFAHAFSAVESRRFYSATVDYVTPIRLAAELCAIRDDRGENLQTVVSALGPGWSTFKLSRYELGTGGLNPREVARLLGHYRAPGALRERLLSLAQAAPGKGWWDAYSDVAPD